MAQVFAGFVVGFGLSLAVAPLGAIALVRSNDRTGFAQRVAPPGTNVIALSVVLHFAAMLMLTAVGIVLGMLLMGLEDRRPAGGLGSPNVMYTAIVLALTAVLFIPAVMLPAVRRPALAGGLLFVGAFGWVMPWLSTLG
ncbi:MAG: hypothetical protein HYX50_01340 [Chloroflexi bacterium]|nr:hypothetical protein [Chloroflexota bacterium]